MKFKLEKNKIITERHDIPLESVSFLGKNKIQLKLYVEFKELKGYKDVYKVNEIIKLPFIGIDTARVIRMPELMEHVVHLCYLLPYFLNKEVFLNFKNTNFSIFKKVLALRIYLRDEYSYMELLTKEDIKRFKTIGADITYYELKIKGRILYINDKSTDV